MSERTTIGGTVYEAIGSSSSNLLLKCNGTARIQWGSKLIDLIKNGKIASGDSQELIFIVTDESQIKSDGIYVLTTEESDQLWICKDGNKYDLTGTDLYISASKEQNLTVEQKKQALDNIGMYYETLEEVQKAGIQTGIVYVIENKTLYTIQNGQIEEFEAKLKTITVDEESEEGVKVINSPVKIVLSILDEEYLVLADQRITANYSIHVKDSAQLGSESADKNQGYRLYIEGGVSWLDVDEINVRNGIKIKQYKEVTYSKFMELLNSDTLEPHMWYLITDFQNHWRLARESSDYTRPILIRALTGHSLYDWGYLFRDHRIKIKYDPTFDDVITQVSIINEVETEKDVSARGKITWMWDTRNNNQANFDFMDYKDAKDEELAFLHQIDNDDSEDKSIFPQGSHDNTLVVHNLKGTVIIDKKINDDNTNEVNFQFDDSEDALMEMYNNDILCRGIVLEPSCTKFYNNTLKKVIKLKIYQDFIGNNFQSVYSRTDFSVIDYSTITFESLGGDSAYSVVAFEYKTENNVSQEFRHCSFLNEMTNSTFGIIENTNFNELIDNSTINWIIRPDTTYVYNLYKITNSTIDEISKDVQFSKEINDSNIIKISDKVQIHGNINNCNIQTILTEVIIQGDLTDSTITEISLQTNILGNITGSTINKITNGVSMEGTIIDSIIEELLTDIPGTCQINKSTIGVILENCSILSTSINNIDAINITNSTLQGNLNNSSFKNITDSKLNSDISSCFFEELYNTIIDGILNNNTFEQVSNSTISGDISNSIFKNLNQVTLNSVFTNVKFKNLTGNVFGEGTITDTVSFYDLSESFDSGSYPLLYITEKRKEIYIHNGKVKIICVPDVIFYRGMIIMHSGIEEIPPGWAPCDGGTYEFDGVTSQTPDLKDKFIRAVGTVGEIGDGETNTDLNEDGTLTLKDYHLPEHNHPHEEHTHELTNITGTADPESVSVSSSSTFAYYHNTTNVVTDVTVSGVEGVSASVSTTPVLNDTTWEFVESSGGSHSHNVTISGGEIKGAISKEETKTWENKSINIEPKHFKLIFIMKL